MLGEIRCKRRILILGPPGAGKSYFSQKLGELLGLEVIHLDALFWRPGRVPTPEPEWREAVAALVQHDAWVMDGTYENTLDLRIPAADAVFLIDKSRTSCLWRIVRRKAIQFGTHRPDAPHGHGGGIDWQLIKYIWCFKSASRSAVIEHMHEHGADCLFVTFKGISGCSALLQALAEARPNERLVPE